MFDNNNTDDDAQSDNYTTDDDATDDSFHHQTAGDDHDSFFDTPATDEQVRSVYDRLSAGESFGTEPAVVRKYKLGRYHRQATEMNAAELREEAMRQASVDDDLSGMLMRAYERLSGHDVQPGDFECPKCGLSHGHGPNKHDIRDGFNVTAEFAEMMEFVPNCHCGVNELAVILQFYDHLPSDLTVFRDEEGRDFNLSSRKRKVRNAADNADISPETERRISDLRETLAETFNTA